jgi:hypothetical protein
MNRIAPFDAIFEMQGSKSASVEQVLEPPRRSLFPAVANPTFIDEEIETVSLW